MIDHPFLEELPVDRQTVDVFGGYDRRPRIGEGAFRDMENMSSDHYPLLAPRQRRGTMLDITDLPEYVRPRTGKLTGAVYTQRQGWIYTQGPNAYIFDAPNDPMELGLDDRPKQFVIMGAYLLIFPDAKYVYLERPEDHGSMGHRAVVDSGTLALTMCDMEGNEYKDAVCADKAPEAPEDGALWIDTSSTPHGLKRWSATNEMWNSVVSTFVKIRGIGYGEDDGSWFAQYDGITISGLKGGASHLNGAAINYSKSLQALIIPGILDEVVTQECTPEETVTVERKIPEMDYVVEAGNRLWGCRYGGTDHTVNEIYGSKLGDFRNFNCFMGIATDSWVGSVGSQGAFTGAANIGGNPVFYKQDRKHKVWISPNGAHQVTETPCQGVAAGCGRSVASIDGVAIYRSARGFCIDDGAEPVQIGDCFDGAGFQDAVGCTAGRKYYVSVMEGVDTPHLFVYDFDRQLWHREDGFRAVSFASAGKSLFAVDAAGERLMVMNNASVLGEGKMEKAVQWMAQTGPIGVDSPDMKYLSRLTLRLSMEVGAELTVFARYDDEPEWVAMGSFQGTSLRSFTLPLRPRRCDHMELRFEGVGDVKLWSITKTIMEGSDIS